MIEGQIGDPERQCKAFGIGSAHKKCRGKAGSGGGRYRTEITGRYPGFGKGAANKGVNGQQVIARGNFRHHATKAGVLLGLRGDQAGEDRAWGTKNCSRGLIAGGLHG
jgi:hypothetical protein